MTGMKQRIAKLMREWADVLDRHGAPKYTQMSFTFEEGVGLAVHVGGIGNGQIGCPLLYLNDDDYRLAFKDSGKRSEGYESYPLTPDRADRRRQ